MNKIPLSNNQLKIFKTCQKKFFWSYIEKLEPKIISMPLIIGKLIHLGLEKLTKNPIENVVEIIKSEINKIIETNTFIDSNGISDLKIQQSTVIGLLIGFNNKYGEHLKNIKGVEMPFDLPFKNLESGRTSQYFTFRGRIDAIADIDNKVWVVEYKTTSQINQSYIDRLQIDQQITSYLWAINQMFGKMPSGVLYYIIKKPGIRQTQKETLDDYLKRLETLPQEEPDNYFQCRKIYRNIDEINDFEQELYDLSVAFRNNKNYYKNTQNCIGFGQCEFLKLCSARTSEEQQEAQTHYKIREEETGEQNKLQETEKE